MIAILVSGAVLLGDEMHTLLMHHCESIMWVVVFSSTCIVIVFIPYVLCRYSLNHTTQPYYLLFGHSIPAGEISLA